MKKIACRILGRFFPRSARSGGERSNIWKAYREEYSNNKNISSSEKTLMYGFARLDLRHVRLSTFGQLSSAGYDVDTFDDGAAPLEPENVPHGNLPGNWKCRQPVLTPKVAILRNAVLFDDGAALLHDGRVCFSTRYFDLDNRMPPHGPRKTLRYVDPVTDGALIRRKLRCAEVPGRCFSTRSRFPRNFGHFVKDVLTRIYYEDLGAIAPGRDKVIAPQFHMPMQEVLFRAVFDGYEIVRPPRDAPLRVEELLLPANLCCYFEFNPAAIAALAKRMRRIMAPYAGKEKYKVCISRRDSEKSDRNRKFLRNFANNDAYETRMRQLGFDVVEVSTLDPETQFALWANTADIVGVHGAAMMNMIMMLSEGNYTEIVGAPVRPDVVGGEFWPNLTIRCAMASGHRVCGLSSRIDPQSRPMIDIERLESELARAAP